MRQKAERRVGELAQLEMTPMIDVVFQLLIFFIVALKQEDIPTRLEAAVPSGSVEAEVVGLMDVQIYKEGYVVKGRRVSLEELDRQFKRLASFNDKISIAIKCTDDSPHKYLIRILDICAKHELKNLSVFHM